MARNTISRRRKKQEAQRRLRRTANQETAMCCIDLDALVLICEDVNDPKHRAVVEQIVADDPKGISVNWRSAAGQTGQGRFLPCSTSEECCYDAKTGKIVCDSRNHPLHDQSADLVEEYGNGYVYICFSTGAKRGAAPCFDLETRTIHGGPFDGTQIPEGGYGLSDDGTMVTIFGLGAEDPNQPADIVLPVCPPGKTCMRIPLCSEPPQVECCYDAMSGTLVCDDPTVNGQPAELISEAVDDAGKPYVVVRHPMLNGGARTTLPLCPDQPPVDCCYDVASGTLRCPGNPEFDGLEVSLEALDTDAQGNQVASVSHPDLPGGGHRFPLCVDKTPPDCCFDGKRQVLVCPNDPDYDGKPAGVVTEFEGPDGSRWVSVAWEGGGARMPLCTDECPPDFCCVNIQTMNFVCASSPLNGTPADVADIITTDDGFNVAVLSDGTRVPTCGRECPPPKLCPPGCPPGKWMSPDGQCVDPPKCPPPGDCPPGYWKDPNGICRRPPECPPQQPCPPRQPCPPQRPCPPTGQPPHRPPKQPPKQPPCEGDVCFPQFPPWWKVEGHCCEKCALGLACEGGCGCGKKHDKKAGNPSHGDAVTYVASQHGDPTKGRAWVRLSKGNRGHLMIPGGRRIPVSVLGVQRKGGHLYSKIRAQTPRRMKKYEGRYRRLRKALTL